MTQNPNIYAQTDLKSLNLVTWRIKRSRSQEHQAEVHRQLLGRLHDTAQAN